MLSDLPYLLQSYFINTLYTLTVKLLNQWYGLERPEIDANLQDQNDFRQSSSFVCWERKVNLDLFLTSHTHTHTRSV